ARMPPSQRWFDGTGRATPRPDGGCLQTDVGEPLPVRSGSASEARSTGTPCSIRNDEAQCTQDSAPGRTRESSGPLHIGQARMAVREAGTDEVSASIDFNAATVAVVE